MNKAVDASPDLAWLDAVASGVTADRLIYADYLDDHGRHKAALFWRWAGAVGFQVYESTVGSGLTLADAAAKLTPHGWDNGDLPTAVFCALTGGRRDDDEPMRFYDAHRTNADNLRDAYLDLLHAADAYEGA